MLMPIVSMNKMAMNESVAATCCYRFISENAVIYQEILHGGYIDPEVVTAKFVHDPLITDAWKAYGKYPSRADYADLSTFKPVFLDGAWKLQEIATTKIFPLTEVGTWIDIDFSNPATSQGYVWEVPDIIFRAHVGATTAHSTATDFAAPHASVQYGS
ncbi:MAG: hypothetical protein LBM74_00240 [Oscillospiraceae bacterium]|jgi:hypothetical protein|nr:hypothetical protein [Oscillospiraceae bacterium]